MCELPHCACAVEFHMLILLRILGVPCLDDYRACGSMEFALFSGSTIQCDPECMQY